MTASNADLCWSVSILSQAAKPRSLGASVESTERERERERERVLLQNLRTTFTLNELVEPIRMLMLLPIVN